MGPGGADEKSIPIPLNARSKMSTILSRTNPAPIEMNPRKITPETKAYSIRGVRVAQRIETVHVGLTWVVDVTYSPTLRHWSV